MEDLYVGSCAGANIAVVRLLEMRGFWLKAHKSNFGAEDGVWENLFKIFSVELFCAPVTSRTKGCDLRRAITREFLTIPLTRVCLFHLYSSSPNLIFGNLLIESEIVIPSAKLEQ